MSSPSTRQKLGELEQDTPLTKSMYTEERWLNALPMQAFDAESGLVALHFRQRFLTVVETSLKYFK